MPQGLFSRNRDKLIFDLFLVIVALVFFFNSLDLNFRSWFFPGVFSIVLLIMAGAQTVMDFHRGRRESNIEDLVMAEEKGKAPRENIRAKLQSKNARAVRVTLSMVAFYLIFRFVTIYIAIPVLCVLLLRFLGKRSWVTVGLVAISMDVFIYLFFQLLLETSL
ncbi:MAG: tripartite tricarboxylate transporter TctB family protein [Thermodesulfobacteriota bacterium]